MPDTVGPIRFGFLPIDWTVQFDQGKIQPIPEFGQVAIAVEKQLNKDGFLYPPIVKTVRCDLEGNIGRTIPKTKRPAHLYEVPPSHDLFIIPRKRESNVREGSAGFILHFLAFLFGTRLQFADWLFDGRIPIRHKRGIGVFIFNDVQLGSYLSHAYGVWSKWREPEQRRFTNILYMFSRAPSYEWEWEEFVIEYMVLDACWRMAQSLFGLRSKTHKARVKALCDHFCLTRIGEFIDIDKMVELRNNLFHEALWHDARPGSTPLRRRGYHMPTQMALLNDQLIRGFLQL